MNTPTIQRFEEIKDILVYVAFSKHEVTSAELEEHVCDKTRAALNQKLRGLVQAGYLAFRCNHCTRLYVATEKTKQLFGVRDMGEV
ncbi:MULTISPECIES: hypothetical protein [Acinetobacter]|jgi:hypothetical protein|uniref:MarR family transcriptional regulator n=1 Tax=Acinetobacter pecorum TaxID=2762215 RepID=A0ABR8VWJ4_9GAMM|nr:MULTISPECIES: hypothetical protein [Acinetobacter]AUC07374.1 hypothetical protein BVG18_11055 [Acinetobacter lwoffii]MBD8008781.1 hypothetical protein [Acinetobacter pecorum]MCO8081977.1 hypothetical protein [Acinetobacter lwoffii]QZM13405.1 hypothetical protein ABVS_2778 [Acinetobacter lwoffii]